MLIWVTGISGAGKTTIAYSLYQKLKTKYPNIVYLDGDEFRAAFGNDLGYTLEDRDKNAFRLTRMGKLLTSQGIHVICGTNLTSQKFRDWCRSEIPGYFEVYLDVPMEVLVKRDKKGVYNDLKQGTMVKNVAGLDIPFTRPENPDLIIDNSEDRTSFDKIVDQIISAAKVKL